MPRFSIALAAVVGGVVGAVAAFLAGVASSVSSECDGPCFDQADRVTLVALAVGAACAVLAALLAWAILRRRDDF